MAVQMEPERLWKKGFVKQMDFKSGMKGTDRWWEWNRDCDEVICARWSEPGGEWTGWTKEKADYTDEVMHIRESMVGEWWFVMRMMLMVRQEQQ